jgi:hypothetical protein
MSSPSQESISGTKLKLLATGRTASAVLFLAIFALAVSYRRPIPLGIELSLWLAGGASLALLAIWRRARGFERVFDRSYIAFLALVFVFGIIVEFT